MFRSRQQPKDRAGTGSEQSEQSGHRRFRERSPDEVASGPGKQAPSKSSEGDLAKCKVARQIGMSKLRGHVVFRDRTRGPGVNRNLTSSARFAAVAPLQAHTTPRALRATALIYIHSSHQRHPRGLPEHPPGAHTPSARYTYIYTYRDISSNPRA